MGFKTAERMKDALLTTTVSWAERVVLLEMGYAVDDNAPVYSWGRDRLARALGKTPGTTAATSAVDRVLGALRKREHIALIAKPHRGRRAVYALSVLDAANAHRSDRRPFDESDHENAHRSDAESTSVSSGMHIAQTDVPLTISTDNSDMKAHRFASRADEQSKTRAATSSQRRFIDDLRSLLDIDDDVIVESTEDADALIRDYWQQIEHRRFRDEPLSGRLADLSPAARRYVREHGLTLDSDAAEGTTRAQRVPEPASDQQIPGAIFISNEVADLEGERQ